MEHVFFWGTPSVFSNWHPATFVMDDLLFANSEQAFMYYKAKCFDDTVSMDNILKTHDPKEAKKLGRLVQGFEQDIWDVYKFDVMFNVLKHKFSQDRKMYIELMSTRGKHLVEASPYDKIWGIGLSVEDATNIDPDKWPGQNLLGKVLDNLRNSFEKDNAEELGKIPWDTLDEDSVSIKFVNYVGFELNIWEGKNIVKSMILPKQLHNALNRLIHDCIDGH